MLENRTEIMQEQTWWKLHCSSCLLVFCAVVWDCLVAKWVMKKKHPTTSIFQLHFSPPEFTKKTNKFYRTNQPRENFGQHNLLYVYLSACWKTGEKLCKNKHGENCIAQVVCWFFVRLCGAAGVGGEVSDEKNNPTTSIFELHFPPPEFTKKTNKF